MLEFEVDDSVCYNTIVFRSLRDKHLHELMTTICKLVDTGYGNYTYLASHYERSEYKNEVDLSEKPDFEGHFQGIFTSCDGIMSYNDLTNEYYFFADSETVSFPMEELLDYIVKLIPGDIDYYISSENPREGTYLNTDIHGYYFSGDNYDRGEVVGFWQIVDWIMWGEYIMKIKKLLVVLFLVAIMLYFSTDMYEITDLTYADIVN